jgi:hypothetical protein
MSTSGNFCWNINFGNYDALAQRFWTLNTNANKSVGAYFRLNVTWTIKSVLNMMCFKRENSSDVKKFPKILVNLKG